MEQKTENGRQLQEQTYRLNKQKEELHQLQIEAKTD
jgi:hypothetical protein